MVTREEIEAARLPELPLRKDFRIGCLGAGFIVRDCHIPAYHSAGWKVQGVASRREATAVAVAKQHGIPKVYASYLELIQDEEIEILDVAVPPDCQPDLIRQALKRKKPLKGILAQKPLAMSIAEAAELVHQCDDQGVKLAVNHNMRYDQSIRAAKFLLQSGELGEVVLATLDMRAIPHWMPWSEGLRSLSTFIMSIHHLDTFRYWLGTPDRVLASTRPDPRTRFPHRDGINLYILEYDSGVRASGWDDVWTGPAREGAGKDIGIRWRIEGTLGMARGTIGWPSYPEKTPSTLDFTSCSRQGEWVTPRWNEVWFPDAFVGTMAQLLVAVEKNSTPAISGLDNLETLALCEAVMQSAETHQAVNPRNLLEPFLR